MGPLAADAALADFQALILDQDRPIAKSERPEELSTLSHELHITQDRVAFDVRRYCVSPARVRRQVR